MDAPILCGIGGRCVPVPGALLEGDFAAGGNHTMRHVPHLFNEIAARTRPHDAIANLTDDLLIENQKNISV